MKSSPTSITQKVEGEGSYSASRRYNEAVAKHLEEGTEDGDVEELAQKAADALDGPEGEELRKAEAEAKRGPRKAPDAK